MTRLQAILYMAREFRISKREAKVRLQAADEQLPTDMRTDKYTEKDVKACMNGAYARLVTEVVNG